MTDMNTSYKELLKQREQLEQQINEARRRELSDAIAQVRSLVSEYGLKGGRRIPFGPRTQRERRYQGGPEIPQSRHWPDLDGPRKGAQVDPGRKSRTIRHLMAQPGRMLRTGHRASRPFP